MTKVRKSTLDQYVKIGDVMYKPAYFNSRQEPQPSGCIHWTGGKHRQGYGMTGGLRVKDKQPIMQTVHRLVLKIKLGRALKKGENAIHTCSNAICCNPDHIIAGSLSKRNEIMHANGRWCMGPKVAGVIVKQDRKYKYTEEQIIFGRTASSKDIAKRYGKTKTWACQHRWAMRNGFAWLPEGYVGRGQGKGRKKK